MPKTGNSSTEVQFDITAAQIVWRVAITLTVPSRVTEVGKMFSHTPGWNWHRVLSKFQFSE
jgi:hypothetical protein